MNYHIRGHLKISALRVQSSECHRLKADIIFEPSPEITKSKRRIFLTTDAWAYSGEKRNVGFFSRRMLGPIVARKASAGDSREEVGTERSTMGSIRMDDEILLQLTKARLRFLQGPQVIKSLRQLCVEATARNIEAFVCSGDATRGDREMQPLANLPKCLQNELLEELGRQRNPNQRKRIFDRGFDTRIKAIKQLLRKKTQKQTPMKIDLTGILNFCPKIALGRTIKKLLRAIAVHAPDVDELVIGQEQEVGEDSFCISESMSDELAKLKSLKSLQVDKCFVFSSFSQLSDMCYHLPNLQVIRTRLHRMEEQNRCTPYWDFSPRSSEELREIFPSLITYSLSNRARDAAQSEVEEKLNEICSANAESTLKRVYLTKSHVYYVGDSFRQTIYTGGPSNYRKVVIEARGENSVPDARGKCRRGEILREGMCSKQEDWSYQGEEMVCTSEAASRSTAFRYDSCVLAEPLPTLLPEVGAQLHTLEIIRPFTGKIDLGRVFTLCPKLERLKATQCSLNVLNITHFAHLRELEFTNFYDYNSDERVELSRLVSAPWLEKVSIKCGMKVLAVQELNKITSSIADGEILRKLGSLAFEVDFDFLDGDIHPDTTTDELLDFVAALSDLLKTASAFLPLLADLRLLGIDSALCLNRFQIGKPKIFVQTCDRTFDSVKRAKEKIDEYFRRCNLTQFVNLYE